MEIDPDVIGRRYMALGRTADADAMFSKALNANPNRPEVWNNLGIARQQQQQYVNAFGCYANVLAIDPNSQSAYCNIGFLAQQAGRLRDAIVFYERAIKLAPDSMVPWHNIASLYKDLRQFDKARACIDKAIELAPDNMQAHLSRIYIYDIDPQTTPQQALDIKRAWANTFRLPAQTRWANSPDPDRKLRIGYMSGDFYQHSANFAFANLIFGHDRQKFDVACYSTTAREDTTTEFMKRGVAWRKIVAASDEQVVEQIKKDKIDILVDLSGFTAGARLPVFTAKPAPIACHMIGYLDGTGIKEIDGIFLDPVLGVQKQYDESVINLPCVFNYRNVHAPDVAPPPSIDRGHVTFGYLGQWRKVSNHTLELWERILRSVPNSRLYLKDRRFADERERMDAICRLGVSSDRVTFAEHTPSYGHLGAHANVDVGLDPIAHNGGVSTLEALWMGVPVVTSPGERASAKVGASILGTLGLSEFASGDYVGDAMRLACNVNRLRDLRFTMRERFAATTIGNAPLYVAHVERAYRKLWAAYCAQVQPFAQPQALAS